MAESGLLKAETAVTARAAGATDSLAGYRNSVQRPFGPVMSPFENSWALTAYPVHVQAAIRPGGRLVRAMSRKMTLRDAFAVFGAKARNPRWSWSARSPDGRTVVLTLWEDDFRPDGTVDMFGQAECRKWRGKPGNQERIENLIYARDHCDRRFRVVRLTPKQGMRPPRSTGATAQRYPDPTLVMELTELDPHTGEFRAKSVAT